jgi:DNA-3-methyladenine glycosylase
MREVKKYSGNGIILKTRFPIEKSMKKKLDRSFFLRDVLNVAPDLVGKILTLRTANDTLNRYLITETEAYRGEADLACHACRGRTPRTEIMYHEGGKIYVYFVYGMYWMLNFVTGNREEPQAALIRGIEGFNGPGKLTRALGIDRSYYGEDLTTSNRIWVEESGLRPEIRTGKRIGIEYAGSIWKEKPWRFYMKI